MAYPTEVPPAGRGGRIVSVEAEGPAHRAGLRPGWIVLDVEGQPLRDIIDWMWSADGTRVEIRVEDSAGRRSDLVLERDWDEPWGIDFDGVVFDGIRECDNACAFCFVAQLPSGMRPSLYVRDDDYRLSFLAGNFVTLTNLDDGDVDRIISQRLSPLHVSLHAVDPEVRQALMCPSVEDRAMEHMDRLLEHGVGLHVQIVLVAGVNDGEVLDRTLEWTAAREGILSVGIVPMGFTRHGRRPAASFEAPDAASVVIEQIGSWQRRAVRDEPWLFAADEFYLAADVELPAWDEYGDFPQYENGIGMARAFIDEALDAVKDLRPSSSGPEVALITGELFAPVLEGLRDALSRTGCFVSVLAVPNDLLGGNVNVAGLLSGKDIVDTLATSGTAAGIYLLTDAAVNDDLLLIDDMTVEEVARRSGADVRLVSCDAAGLVSALSALTVSNSG